MGADIRRKEGRESDRICIEEEKRIRGSKSGIEKSTGRCEEASRWKTTESRKLEEGQQSNTKYKRLCIQRKTSEKVDGEIYRALWDKRSSIKKYGQVKTASLYKGLSSSKH